MILFLAGASGLVLLGAAPSYVWLLTGAAVAGIPLSVANPATNRLVAEHLPAGGRGAVMGLKQSGVQAGALLAGVSLPVTAGVFGWRPVLVAAAGLPLLALVIALLLLPPDATPWLPPAWSAASSAGPSSRLRLGDQGSAQRRRAGDTCCWACLGRWGCARSILRRDRRSAAAHPALAVEAGRAAGVGSGPRAGRA